MSTILYHYTTKKAGESILADGYLRRSTNSTTDAIIGLGIYLTSKSPRSDKRDLMFNNWHTYSADDKMECVIMIKIKDDHPALVDGRQRLNRRDVWLFEREYLFLNEFPGFQVKNTSITLYHYTNEEGRNGIRRDGNIRASRGSQHVLGEGVYLHEIKPEKGRTAIAQNNWDNWQNALTQGKGDYCFEIKMSLFDAKLIDGTMSRGWDVYMYEGDLDLSDFQWCERSV